VCCAASDAGGEWDAISADAKDLVQKMLHPNPLERITTAQIMQHPWLRQLEQDQISELEVNINVSHLLASGIDLNNDTSFSKRFTGSSGSNPRKGSGVNLVGTLRQLSGHVKQRRSEKMATNLSRIVSSLLQQQDGGSAGGRSTLAAQYLIPVDGSGGGSAGGSARGSGGAGALI
jgi:serine/threonine protein kinase